MKYLYIKGLMVIVISLLLIPSSYGQSNLIAYSMKPGNISTNGQTTLWASIGGFSTGASTSGSTTLNPGVLAEGLSTETVLGLLSELERSIFIYQNFGANEVVIKNLTTYPIESASIIDINGKTMEMEFNNRRDGKSTLRFGTTSLTTGIYLIQVTINGLPISKKFLVK